MRHIAFDKTFDTAIFIKSSALNQSGIEESYINKCGLSKTGLVAFDLDYGGKKKSSAEVRKHYLAGLLKGIDKLKVTHVLCCDTEYFKTMTGQQNTEKALGYVFPCKIVGFEHINVIYSFNYQILFNKPDYIKKIRLSVNALVTHKAGNYVELGTGIIHSESYPNSVKAIKDTLAQLHQYDTLTCDFETIGVCPEYMFKLEHELSQVNKRIEENTYG